MEVHLDLPTVLVAHFAISGSKLPTGLPVDQMREPVLSWPDLDAIGFDCVIGAHVHEAQQISNPALDQTLGFVVGSPQQLNFGETGDHGVWIVDIEQGAAGNAVTTEFVPIKSKKFVTLDVDVAGEDGLVDPQEWVLTAFDPLTLDTFKGDIIRFRYRATEDEARRIDHGALRRALLDAGASRVSVEPQIVRGTRARAEHISEQISPGEALAAWCETQDVDAVLAERMLATLKDWRS
jgi:hypothetical protein